MVHFHRSRQELIFRTTSLRTRELSFRHINYGRMIVDERLLTRAFPYVAGGSRHWCVIMLGGTLEAGGARPLRATAGDCVLFGASGKSVARWTSGEFLELEWTRRGRAPPRTASSLGRVDLSQARALAAAIDDRTADAGDAIALGLQLFRDAGAPLSASLGGSREAPTAEDLRLAAAIDAQINDLKGSATTLGLADGALRSPRQLQRVVQRFNETYGLNAGNWRDMRNRIRVQLAALMLSLADRSIAEIAREVGYGSPNALGRAFASVGLPSPAEFREAVLAADVR